MRANISPKRDTLEEFCCQKNDTNLKDYIICQPVCNIIDFVLLELSVHSVVLIVHCPFVAVAVAVAEVIVQYKYLVQYLTIQY